MDSDKSSFLVLVIDVHSLIFSVISKCERDAIGGVVQDICGSITYFCSSYALMHRQNCLSVICSASDGSNVVYPLLNMDDGGFVPVLHELARDLSQVIYRVAANEISQMTEPRNPTSDNGKLSLARAFSLALSTLNRHREMQSRILVLQFDRDRSRNYNSIMNSIFRYCCVQLLIQWGHQSTYYYLFVDSAQKLGVLVDALVLANFDSHLLQVTTAVLNLLYSTFCRYYLHGT